MTTLIQQQSPNDCVLAAIAMAKGAEKWSDVWTPEDLQNVVESKGVKDVGSWIKKAGFASHLEVYVRSETCHVVKRLLWRRPALLSVDSLNNSGGSHMVFWDGEKLWDPHEGHYPEFIAFRHLSSVSISEVYLFEP